MMNTLQWKEFVSANKAIICNTVLSRENMQQYLLVKSTLNFYAANTHAAKQTFWGV